MFNIQMSLIPSSW